MAKSIEQYFRLLPKGQASRPGGGRLWYPSADVYRTRDGWIVKVELAGVRADEIAPRGLPPRHLLRGERLLPPA
jgi:HSP20 family protein